MDSLFSKASSFLSSQEAPQAPSHGEKVAHDKDEEETRKPASSGGYGDLLAGAQALMGAAKPSDGGASAAKEGETHKAGGYGDIFASAQSLMGAAKSSSGGAAADKEEEEREEAHKPASSGGSGYADVFASAQVLMGAAKISSREGASAADMGEVAGAASNIIGAASRYGNLEKTSYGEYTQKAQSYLHDYQVSHSKTAPQGMTKPSASQEKDEEDYNPSIKPSANSEGETDEESFNPQSRTPGTPIEKTKYEEDYRVNSKEAEQEYE